MSELKEQLHQLCVKYVQQRMEAAQHAINEAQQASNDDTKSSAGDKYETGREMAQQETNRNLTQLNEANKLMVALNQLSTSGHSTTADAGSVVITNNGNFYLSISAGSLMLNNVGYFAISPASPIGAKMRGCKAGDSFSMNGKEYEVKEVL
ncbi:GreA/GreB family elongation factor [Mucilaginibacter daejeonensis]|uniref:GreA/GreB family elongation factor n=1 Tax=Mucilaginibacter daejeonensis TaxID=398049 RepID=UPI001D176693|nr:GreA/GreB family elongation factor [Mucilaginibacter daejeonensis]UEG51816.1 GreA/GreB family elongation factor [Mucilaginibacter daejeonensis]